MRTKESGIAIGLRCLIVIIIITLTLPPSALDQTPDDNVDFDADGLSDGFEFSLALRYAPRFVFDPREDYFYSDPAALIDNCGAALNSRFRGYGNPNRPGFEPGDCWRVGFDLGESYYPPGGYYAPPGSTFSQYISHYNEMEIAQVDPGMYELLCRFQAPGGLAWDRVTLIPPNWLGAYYLLFDKALKYAFDPLAPVFFLVEINEEGNLELQYWQFSHCDDKNVSTDRLYQVDHLCDWSRVAIVFRWDSGYVQHPPLYAFYSCHKSPLQSGNAPFHPRYLLWEDVHCDAEGHPIVLVSHNQHELYFENEWFPIVAHPGIMYEENVIRDELTGCNIRPYFIRREVGHDYFDQVGNGIHFVPGQQNLYNMGNGANPNITMHWLTFGGKWFDGPEGPLGPGAKVRFRQHMVWRDAEMDDGSVYRIYQGLATYGSGKWRKQCPADCVDLVHSVLVPQGFLATARASELGQWPK